MSPPHHHHHHLILHEIAALESIQEAEGATQAR